MLFGRFPFKTDGAVETNTILFLIVLKLKCIVSFRFLNNEMSSIKKIKTCCRVLIVSSFLSQAFVATFHA